VSVEETLKRIEKKLGKIESELEEIRKQILEPDLIGQKSLVELPDHLRRTAIGLMRIGQGTASDVSRRTGRARAVESGYLNQLERQGYVTSFRRSRQKFFSIDSELIASPKIPDA
jgi:DNA-binding transcriptional ArsR family regulator